MTIHGENEYNNFKTETGAIEAAEKINPQNIDESNYFMSLVNEAFEAGILVESEIAYMQSQISDILADSIWQYTGGTSTSVAAETAAELIESIVFVLDCFCIFTVKINAGSIGNDKCVEILREKAGIKNCHSKGVEYVEQIVNDTKNLYNEVYAGKLNIGISLYNITINKSIAIFFKKYNRYLMAHKIEPLEPAIDYPLAMLSEIKGYKGILYVRKYLQILRLENEFCSVLDINDLRGVIKTYARNNRFVAEDLMENIFRIVFESIFTAVFSNLGEKELTEKHIREFTAGLKIENPELIKYILKYWGNHSVSLMRMLRQKKNE